MRELSPGQLLHSGNVCIAADASARVWNAEPIIFIFMPSGSVLITRH
jgi:hypothetical protein